MLNSGPQPTVICDFVTWIRLVHCTVLYVIWRHVSVPGSIRCYGTDILSSVLAVIHHLTSLATRLHGDLYCYYSELGSNALSSVG